MAHSLRSKTKLKSKKLKTSAPNSDYFKAAEERTQRLANKLKDNLEKQKDAANNESTTTSADQMETDEATEKSMLNTAELQNVKTHGWRKSRASSYKKKKAAKNKNKTMKF